MVWHFACNSCRHETVSKTSEPCIICKNNNRWSPKSGMPTYWERIEALAERQRVKGMTKYGYGLEMNPAAIVERINHLEEELIDGLMYCEWIKEHFNV